jgi:hypothetical protein
MRDIMCRATTANEGGNHATSSVLVVFYHRVVSRCLLPIERRSEEEDAAVQVASASAVFYQHSKRIPRPDHRRELHLCSV